MTLLGLPQALAPLFIGLYLVAPFAGWINERALPIYIATLLLPVLMFGAILIVARRARKRREAFAPEPEAQ